MSVFDGTQSVSTQAPPSPSRVHHGDPRPELGGDQGGLVPARAAAEDHDARLRLAHDASILVACRAG